MELTQKLKHMLKEPSQEQVKQLMDAVLSKKAITLNATQEAKFMHACYKAIIENTDASVKELEMAGKIYLNFILDFPDLTL